MRYYLIAIIFIAASVGCQKEARRLFTIPYFVTFEMQAGLNPVLDHHFITNNIPSNYEALLDQNGYQDSDVNRINPASARMIAQFGDGSFDWIFEVSVVMYDPADPGLQKEIFYRDNIPANTGATLDLIPTLVDVTDFIENGNYSIDVVLRQLRGPSPQFIQTRLDYRFDVK